VGRYVGIDNGGWLLVGKKGQDGQYFVVEVKVGKKKTMEKVKIKY
jgi:hypothetical protein